MERKRILFTKVNTAELVSAPVEPVTPGKVLVKLAVSTISSGTERANIIGDPNVRGRLAPEVSWPRDAGYSSAGVVVEVGEGVTGLKPGDRVALTESTHSEFVTCSAKNAIPIDDISFEEAALWHIATFPLAAIRKCKLEIGESAIVMGQGVLGMMAVKLLRAAGAAPILAVDPVPEKREQALKIGADYAFDPFDPEFTAKVKALTGGVKVAIEVTGNGKALDSVLDCMANFGRVALLGCTRNSDFTIDYYRKVHCPGIQMIGAHTNARPKQESYPGMWTTRDDVLAIKRLHQLGRLEFGDMIAETHAPQECYEVFYRLATQPSFPLVQIDWRQL